MAGRPIRAVGASPAGEDGFAIVEVIVGMGLFALLAIGFAGTMASSLRAQLTTRERTAAVQLASERIETARTMPYDQLGTVGGNPPGTIQPTAPVPVGSTTYQVQTEITYVDDKIPTGFQTFANFKRVVVTVFEDGQRLARLRTNVAPPTQPSLTKAVVRARIIDAATLLPVPGLSLRLEGGPGGLRTAETNATGEALFPALDPNPLTGPFAHYQVSVSSPSWLTIREHQPDQAPARAQLAATQTFTPVLKVHRPVSLRVTLTTAGGALWTDPATVVVRSPRGWEAWPVTGGTLDITTIAGEPIVPGIGDASAYEVAAFAPGARFASVARTDFAGYPTSLVATASRPLTAVAGTRSVIVRLRAGSAPVAGRPVLVRGGTFDVLVAGTTDAAGNVTLAVPDDGGTYVAESGTATATATADVTLQVAP